jgi:cytochrome c oxidase subunit 1
VSATADRPAAGAARARRPTTVELIATTDHKRIAVLTGFVSLVFFLAGGLLALVMRSELAEPGMQVVSHDEYNQLFTMHGSTMIFLVVTPVALALGIYFVPLQVGAAEIAWPRLALASLWLLATGGLTMWTGFLTSNGAGKAGWTAYYPLSGGTSTPGPGMTMWILGVSLATGASLLQGACILATIVRHRAPGMTMLRLPVFTWTMLSASILTVLSFPSLLLAMVLLWADRQFGGVFTDTGGPIGYQHLFWFYGHPVVYVMFFPFLGAVAEVIAVFSGRGIFGYRTLVFSLLAFTAFSMSVWAHHMFATGQVPNRYYALTSIALALPAGIEYFDLVMTMIRGRIRLTVAMLFALGFLVQFLVGGLTGLFVASPALDYHVHDTYYVVAHFHYTLFAGSLFGLFAAVYYWFPKVTGGFLSERLGRWQFGFLVLGSNLTFFPMFLLGQDGMTRRVANYRSSDGFTGLNQIATAGSFLIAVGIVLFVWNLVASLRHLDPAPADPWGGHTLEWAASSPPGRHNFDALPPIRSSTPLLDLRRADP